MSNKIDENLILWRYMDFTKFVSLLESQSLYFCRADLLKSLDPYEGCLSIVEKQICNDPLLLNSYKDPTTGEEGYIGYINNHARFIFASCWHNFDYENYLMWKTYGLNNSSIAIKISLGDLIDSFNNTLDITPYNIKYIDYEKKFFPISISIGTGNSAIDYYTRKAKYFESEKELRLIYEITPENFESKKEKRKIEYHKNNPEKEGWIDGVFIPINLETLLKEIYICPSGDKWFEKLVENVINTYKQKHQLEFDTKINNSKLSRKHNEQFTTQIPCTIPH